MAINKTSGRLEKVVNKKSGISIPVDQQFLWYWASDGQNINSTQVCYLLLHRVLLFVLFCRHQMLIFFVQIHPLNIP